MDELIATRNVRVKPMERGGCDAKELESVEKDGMIDGLKGGTQIKKNEDGKESRVRCSEEVIGDFNESSAMTGTEGGLEEFIVLV